MIYTPQKKTRFLGCWPAGKRLERQEAGGEHADVGRQEKTPLPRDGAIEVERGWRLLGAIANGGDHGLQEGSHAWNCDVHVRKQRLHGLETEIGSFSWCMGRCLAHTTVDGQNIQTLQHALC